MPVCVYVAPAGTVIGTSNGRDVLSNGTSLVEQPSCVSGLQILTQTEINANKQQLTVDKSSDAATRADLFDLFYMFIAVFIAVWGVKRLLDLFSGEGDK